MSNEWTHITAGLPPCDGETVFVGINSNGYCGCFNDISRLTTSRRESVFYIYETAEGADKIMTDLVQWKRLEMPGV